MKIQTFDWEMSVYEAATNKNQPLSLDAFEALQNGFFNCSQGAKYDCLIVLELKSANLLLHNRQKNLQSN